VEEALYSKDIAVLLSKMNLEEQIAYLDKENYFSSFNFSKKEQTSDPVIYSMRLMNNFSDTEPLKVFQDYFVRANRLYLLPGFVEAKKQVYRYLHAFDIKINDYTLEKNFGARFSLTPGPLLTRIEYRDVLEAYIRAFQGNLTIKSLKDSIQLATKWETFSLEDYKSPTLSPTKLQLYNDWTISPLKFLLSLPESLIADKAKTNVVRSLLNEIKEVQTDYMIFYDIFRNENIPIPMKKKPTIHYNRGEELKNEESHELSTLTMSFRDNPFDLFGSYDSTFYFNQTLDYDADTKPEIVGIQQVRSYLEQTAGDETASVKHYSLMIPRGFHYTKNTSDETLYFTINTNQDTTSSFELYASLRVDGNYRLIETVSNDKQQVTISFLHNALGSGNLYYKSRSKDPSEASLFTLPIFIGNQTLVPYFEENETLDEDYLLDDTRVVDSQQGIEILISYVFDLTIY
jgi:hypothetical protein